MNKKTSLKKCSFRIVPKGYQKNTVGIPFYPVGESVRLSAYLTLCVYLTLSFITLNIKTLEYLLKSFF